MKNRGNLRQVKVMDCGKVAFEGYFHYFSTVGNVQDGLFIAALIEDEGGGLSEYDAVNIVFTDV